MTRHGSIGKRGFAALFVAAALFVTALPAAARTVTDQLGRTVTIPDKVERVVCLQHHALNMMLEMQAGDRLVGILDTWKKDLSEGILKVWPKLDELPMPGGLRAVNVEEVLALKPDLVIVTHYFPKEFIEQMEKAKLPVVAFSFYRADYEQASRLNPKLIDPDKAYTEGMKDGIALMGEILGTQDKAAELTAYIMEKRELVGTRLADVPEEKKIRCYMANPDLYTYGSGKYTGVIMDRAGGKNVAAELDGYQQVSMEQILLWAPQVIFVQDRYRKVFDEIRTEGTWAELDAVKDGKVYLTPEYVKPWGHPCPESMALGELWMAKKLYPDLFADVDLQEAANDFYTRFYGVPYSGEH